MNRSAFDRLIERAGPIEQVMRKGLIADVLKLAKGYSNDAINYPEHAAESRLRAWGLYSTAGKLGFVDC